jgi:hypothetical protein
MPKRKPEVRMKSWGIYTKWNSGAKELPRIQQFTTEVDAVIDVEFGFIVNIKSAKNSELEFCIDHPGILDVNGKRRDPFDGTVFVKTNDWDFYLGDTIWDPIEDKLGDWHLWLKLNDKIIAEKTFTLLGR